MNDWMNSISERVSGVCSTEITPGERCVSMAAGTALVGWVVARASMSRVLLAAAGGYLIYRGATGRCPISEQLGCARPGSQHPFERQERDFGADYGSEDAFGGDESQRRSMNTPERSESYSASDVDMPHEPDAVDEALEETFPASDPPAYSSAASSPAARPEATGQPRKDA